MMYKIKLQECMISTNKYIYIYTYWHLVFKFRTVVYMRVCGGGLFLHKQHIYIYIYIYIHIWDDCEQD